MTNKKEWGDRTIAFAVMIQSLLLVMQTIMIGYYNMDAEDTTIYRVVLTAIPMVAAMIIAFARKPFRFIFGFVIVCLFLLYTVAVFPDNTPFVISQGTRFLLPVVVPSFLCLTVVHDYKIVEKTLYVVSWFTMILVLFYIIGFFLGKVSFTKYDMAFSFACVLPFVSLYSHRKQYDWVACTVLFVMVVAIGARGSAMCMLLYVVLDLFQHKSIWRIPTLALIIVFFVSLPLLNDWFDSIGISSRSLNMLLDGDITSDSGRLAIRTFFIEKLMEHPFIGIGLFGDRLYEDVAYCHNIVLEIVLDFGIILGGAFVIIGIIKLISSYCKSDSDNRNRIVRYFCALVIPFMTSGSYLINSNFAIFLGLCFLISKQQKAQLNDSNA